MRLPATDEHLRPARLFAKEKPGAAMAWNDPSHMMLMPQDLPAWLRHEAGVCGAITTYTIVKTFDNRILYKYIYQIFSL